MLCIQSVIQKTHKNSSPCIKSCFTDRWWKFWTYSIIQIASSLEKVVKEEKRKTGLINYFYLYTEAPGAVPALTAFLRISIESEFSIGRFQWELQKETFLSTNICKPKQNVASSLQIYV